MVVFRIKHCLRAHWIPHRSCVSVSALVFCTYNVDMQPLLSFSVHSLDIQLIYSEMEYASLFVFLLRETTSRLETDV